MALVSAMMPPFVAQYPAHKGSTKNPFTEHILMMQPCARPGKLQGRSEAYPGAGSRDYGNSILELHRSSFSLTKCEKISTRRAQKETQPRPQSRALSFQMPLKLKPST